MKLIERPEARRQGLIRYFTGRPCKMGHISERQVSNGNCCECDLHKERIANMSVKAVERRRFLQRKEGRPADAYERNKHSMRMTVSYRKARKLQATPGWADSNAIELIYAEARRLSEETGVTHEVDHIPANLRPLPASHNRSKGNRYWPGHPNER